MKPIRSGIAAQFFLSFLVASVALGTVSGDDGYSNRARERENQRRIIATTDGSSVKSDAEQQRVMPTAEIKSSTPPQPVQSESPAVETTIDQETGKSRIELVRRARVRAEIQNEDVLMERLETLRMRDEEARMKRLGIVSDAPFTGN